MKTKKKKKKKKLGFHGCYIEELKRWVPMQEAVDWHRKCLGKKSGVASQEFTKLQVAIADFIDEWGGYPVNCFSTEGYYKGLPEFLEEQGLEKGAVRSRKKISAKPFIKDINEAWKLYRITNPPPPPLPLPEEPKKKWERDPNKPDRKKIFGHDVSSVIRRLGIEGFDADEVRQVVDHFGIECKDTTIKGQLWCGTQKGKYGLAANLTEGEMNVIFGIFKKKTEAKKTK